MTKVTASPIRVLVTKIGLDGHDRGSRIVAAYLRDAGMEVIYTPPWQSIAAVVKLAMEEDVDVIGISSLATDHLIVPKMMDALRAAGLHHVRVIVGGIVPEEEKAALLTAGVSRVFGPGPHATRSSNSSHRLASNRAWSASMNSGRSHDPEAIQLPLPGFEQAQGRWRSQYARQIGEESADKEPLAASRSSRSTRRATGTATSFLENLGFPGQFPFTRGIYPTMHRGRTWTQRQLIGLGTPEDYNKRVRVILDAGATAISLLPCNSGFRGVDCDEVDPVLLGTCGTVINTTDHMDRALDGVPLGEHLDRDERPVAVHAARLHARRGAKRRGIRWRSITGTSNQSDYISHFIANHMFYRLSLPGARRVLLDHIEFCRRHVPGWNPVSVVGQHMQQAGATPVETMGFTLSTALQYAQDCIDRGMDIDDVLRRFTFFFDISISFFEEVAKFRAGRRIWARLARERLGAKDPASWRFKFHAQTSGVDLTRAAAAQQYRPRRRAGDGGHHERTAIAAHRRLRRSDHRADRGDGAHCGGHAEHPARGGAICATSSIRSAAPTTSRR